MTSDLGLILRLPSQFSSSVLEFGGSRYNCRQSTTYLKLKSSGTFLSTVVNKRPVLESLTEITHDTI